jgi:murein DD-endopeptidase MepM/ murein hydrolase activator NlpD
LIGKRTHIGSALALALVLTATVSFPSSADTSSELRSTKARLAELDRHLNDLAARYSAAETELARIEAKMAETEQRIERVKGSIRQYQQAISARARDAYVSGGGGTVELLLSSGSFSEFSDRVIYLGQMAQEDSDLVTKAAVSRERLRRYQDDLDHLRAAQREKVASLAAQRADIASQFRRVQAEVSSLQRKLAAEQRAVRVAASIGTRIVRGGALQACPVGQPRAYSDDFGAPRSGGRTHQGNDILAPYGTPVYAAQSGRFEQNYNSLGGMSALVYASNGDYTYYAHMSSYAGVGSGASVAAGTMIGHVGNTGDASGGPYHLHFEYHPGGGGAVDPYPYLKAVCG